MGLCNLANYVSPLGKLEEVDSGFWKRILAFPIRQGTNSTYFWSCAQWANRVPRRRRIEKEAPTRPMVPVQPTGALPENIYFVFPKQRTIKGHGYF